MTTVTTADRARPPLAEGEDALRVLVVDDHADDRDVMESIARAYGLEFHGLGDVARIYEEILRVDPDVVVLELGLPGGGLALCSDLKTGESTRLIPVAIVTRIDVRETRIGALAADCDEFVAKPVDRHEFGLRLRTLAQLHRARRGVDSSEAVVAELARAVEARDGSTTEHCERLSRGGRLFGRTLGLRADDLASLARAGALHDVGQVFVPESILLKPGPLAPDEWRVMRTHPAAGANLLGPIASLRGVVPIVRHHHERWDGGGYPAGLVGEGIPSLARVFQILDAFDALTSPRPYRGPHAPDRALEILGREAATGRWDPRLFREFEGWLGGHGFVRWRLGRI